QARFEGEGAADEEGHEVGVVVPDLGDVGDLITEAPVLPDAVAGQIGAQVAAGRQGRFDLPGFDDVDDRTRLRVALSEQEHVEGPVGGHADEVRLDQAGSHPRGGAREPASDPEPGLRTRREFGGRPGLRWPGRAHRPAPAKAEMATPSDSRRARAARAMSIEPCESPWKQIDCASTSMRLPSIAST